LGRGKKPWFRASNPYFPFRQEGQKSREAVGGVFPRCTRGFKIGQGGSARGKGKKRGRGAGGGGGPCWVSLGGFPGAIWEMFFPLSWGRWPRPNIGGGDLRCWGTPDRGRAGNPGDLRGKSFPNNFEGLCWPCFPNDSKPVGGGDSIFEVLAGPGPGRWLHRPLGGKVYQQTAFFEGPRVEGGGFSKPRLRGGLAEFCSRKRAISGLRREGLFLGGAREVVQGKFPHPENLQDRALRVKWPGGGQAPGQSLAEKADLFSGGRLSAGRHFPKKDHTQIGTPKRSGGPFAREKGGDGGCKRRRATVLRFPRGGTIGWVLPRWIKYMRWGRAGGTFGGGGIPADAGMGSSFNWGNPRGMGAAI